MATLIPAKAAPATPLIPGAMAKLTAIAPPTAAAAHAIFAKLPKLSLKGSRINVERVWNRQGLRFAAPHFRAQLLCNHRGVDAISDNLRLDENDEFGALIRLARGAKRRADVRNLIEARDTAARLLLLVLNQSGELHCLPADHRNLA